MSKSEEAFRFVLENGPRIELDHHIVYYTRKFNHLRYEPLMRWKPHLDYELGRLLACQGRHDAARNEFELVISGKYLEVGPSGRKVWC
jgi:hypothetical protein